MPSGVRKNIIKTVDEAVKKMQKIGVENIYGVSGEHKALNMVTHEWSPYYTVHYNKRAEFEISTEVFKKLVKRGIFTLDE